MSQDKETERLTYRTIYLYRKFAHRPGRDNDYDTRISGQQLKQQSIE